MNDTDHDHWVPSQVRRLKMRRKMKAINALSKQLWQRPSDKKQAVNVFCLRSGWLRWGTHGQARAVVRRTGLPKCSHGRPQPPFIWQGCLCALTRLLSSHNLLTVTNATAHIYHHHSHKPRQNGIPHSLSVSFLLFFFLNHESWKCVDSVGDELKSRFGVLNDVVMTWTQRTGQ